MATSGLTADKSNLPCGGVTVCRHSAAEPRRDAGESVEEVSRFLDHSSLAVTTTYLRRSKGRKTRAGRRSQKPLVFSHPVVAPMLLRR
jgi:hypothetical protein